MESLTTEEFFKHVAVNAKVVDLETVKSVYYGMIKTISRELRDKRKIKLPDWGEFYLLICKERRTLDVNTRQYIVIPPTPTVKFKPVEGVKQHFYLLGQRGL